MTSLNRACISLGEKCNLDCRYCHFTPRLQGGTQEFKQSELIRIIDNIQLHCQCYDTDFKLGLVGSGEPLLQFDLIKAVVEHVVLSGHQQISFYTVTNGTLMKPSMLEFFYLHRDIISVCYSLDGYEALHNIGRERFRVVWKSIERYESLFGVKPAINCTVHRETLEQADALCEFIVNHKFEKVTFSPLFDVNDPALSIGDDEFAAFMQRCGNTSMVLRQTECSAEKKYDCAKYGSLCGVGKNNPFITRHGVYPCGRFYGNPEYRYGAFDTDFATIEAQFALMKPVQDGQCYFDEYCSSPLSSFSQKKSESRR